MKGYIPENLNLCSIRHPDKLYYIITLIYYRRIYDKRITKESYVTLNSRLLLYLLGGNYKKLLNFLFSKGIIECNNHYIPGIESKGFRLTDTYKHQKVIEVGIHDKTLIEKIEKFKQVQEKIIRLTHHLYIKDCLENVSFDAESARKFVTDNVFDIDQFNAYIISVDMLESKTFYFVIDTVAGRVHNNITNLARELRQFISYKNQKLLEIDIANSQPFLFNILIQEYYKTFSQEKVVDWESVIGDNLYIPYGYRNIDIGYGDHDVQLYMALTSAGKFYEYLMEELDICEDRSSFKLRFYSKIFFGRENMFYPSEEWLQFQRLFPTVSRIISYFKKDDYRNLAITLQKAEADIMINSVVPELKAEEIYCLTIHDSILTISENVERVKEIIIEQFKRKFNLIPTIKVK